MCRNPIVFKFLVSFIKCSNLLWLKGQLIFNLVKIKVNALYLISFSNVCTAMFSGKSKFPSSIQFFFYFNTSIVPLLYRSRFQICSDTKNKCLWPFSKIPNQKPHIWPLTPSVLWLFLSLLCNFIQSKSIYSWVDFIVWKFISWNF